jgi:hypothetical protein
LAIIQVSKGTFVSVIAPGACDTHMLDSRIAIAGRYQAATMSYLFAFGNQLSGAPGKRTNERREDDSVELLSQGPR